MSFPSKFTSFDKSILAKISYLILDEVEVISLSDLIKEKISKFNDVSELLLALDVLYILGKIELDESNGVIKYVN
jgi:hypothetical protein